MTTPTTPSTTASPACVAAIRIDTDGTVTVLADHCYDTIRNAVGGWIEAISTDGRIDIFVNEEGKIDRLDQNPLGQALWAQVDSYGCIRAGDWMAGPCVVTGPVDHDGDVTDAPAWVLALLDPFISDSDEATA